MTETVAPLARLMPGSTLAACAADATCAAFVDGVWPPARPRTSAPLTITAPKRPGVFPQLTPLRPAPAFHWLPPRCFMDLLLPRLPRPGLLLSAAQQRS